VALFDAPKKKSQKIQELRLASELQLPVHLHRKPKPGGTRSCRHLIVKLCDIKVASTAWWFVQKCSGMFCMHSYNIGGGCLVHRGAKVY